MPFQSTHWCMMVQREQPNKSGFDKEYLDIGDSPASSESRSLDADLLPLVIAAACSSVTEINSMQATLQVLSSAVDSMMQEKSITMSGEASQFALSLRHINMLSSRHPSFSAQFFQLHSTMFKSRHRLNSLERWQPLLWKNSRPTCIFGD